MGGEKCGTPEEEDAPEGTPEKDGKQEEKIGKIAQKKTIRRWRHMKFLRCAVLFSALLPLVSLTWEKGANGNFIAWDSHHVMKVEVSHPAWKFIKNYVDNYQEPVLVIDSASGNQVTFTVTLNDGVSVEWLYIYWGDGTGEFVQPGQSYTHTYNQKSRYNPSIAGLVMGSIISTDPSPTDIVRGDILSIEFKLMDAWTEEPTEWPRPSYTPPTTGNADLDQYLSDKAIDNSSYTRKVDMCYNDAEGNCLGNNEPGSTCIRACIY